MLNRWIACFKYRGTRRYLGVFLTEEDALAALGAKRRELYGELRLRITPRLQRQQGSG